LECCLGPSDQSKCKSVLDVGEYFLTLLSIADSHFTFHNFFILYAIHVLDSGGILCYCLCVLTVLTNVDSHTIITIFCMFWLYLMFFLTDRFVFSVFDYR
jgi:hypothetical protein